MTRSISAILGLVAVLLVAAPAGAVNVPGCGEFVLFAKTSITFEQGNTILTGNILAQGSTGFVKVGAHNIIHGTVSANRITVGQDAVVDNCVANVIELLGTGKCLTSSIGFTPPAACLASFPPAPLTIPTFPSVCSGGTVNVAPNTTATLAPGCYDKVRVNKGATLVLNAGGEYFVKGEFRQLGGDQAGDGSTVIGGNGSPDAAAIINVAGAYITEVGVFMTNLRINSTNTSGQAVQIFNNSLLKDVVISSLGSVHPHTGVQLRGDTELIGVTFDVQPITNEAGAPNVEVCVCRTGTHFLLDTPTNVNDRLCVPD